jgi:hypothetical protein
MEYSGIVPFHCNGTVSFVWDKMCNGMVSFSVWLRPKNWNGMAKIGFNSPLS